MDNLIRVYDDVIDEESCQLLIEKFESFEDRLEVIYEKDEEERIFNIVWVFSNGM